MPAGEPHQDRVECPACRQERPAGSMRDGDLVPPAVGAMIQRDHPGWSPDQAVCQVCLNQGKASFMQNILEAELEKLTPLDHQVINSVRNGELITTSPLDGFEAAPSRSEQLAERMTAAIGNWLFPISILVLLTLWVGLNVLRRPFEPYPVIILATISAVLGSLAALEGPIILMSQRRQAKRDRLRAINDYRVNLKAELEIRYLNEKIDHLLACQPHAPAEGSTQRLLPAISKTK